MVKKIIFVILFWGMFFLFGSEVLASGFNLKSIGEVDTSGRQISQWWYSGSTPIFRGEAGAGTSVEVDIDGEKGTAVTDESGNWSYSSPTLTDGDHQIVLTNSESSISFTLTTGVDNVNWEAVGSGSGEALPAAGIIWPGLVILLTGAGGIVGGGKMIRASKK